MDTFFTFFFYLHSLSIPPPFSSPPLPLPPPSPPHSSPLTPTPISPTPWCCAAASAQVPIWSVTWPYWAAAAVAVAAAVAARGGGGGGGQKPDLLVYCWSISTQHMVIALHYNKTDVHYNPITWSISTQHLCH